MDAAWKDPSAPLIVSGSRGYMNGHGWLRRARREPASGWCWREPPKGAYSRDRPCTNGSRHPRSAARGPQELGGRRLPHSDCRAGFAVPNAIGARRLCRAAMSQRSTRYHRRPRILYSVRCAAFRMPGSVLQNGHRHSVHARDTAALLPGLLPAGWKTGSAAGACVCRGGCAGAIASSRPVPLRPGRSVSEMSGVSRRIRPKYSAGCPQLFRTTP